MTDNQTVQSYIDAWTHSVEAITELLAPVPTDSWNRPTECPGWSVRDVVSHIIGVESELLGDPRPIHSLPGDLRHVTGEYARYIELPVDKRRCHTPIEVISELEYTVIRRSRALRNARHEPGDLVRWPAGPLSEDVPYVELLRRRAGDVWVLEQDLRRALRTPGNLSAPGALVTRDLLLQGLPDVVARRAGAPAGTTVAFEVTGPVGFLRTVRVDASGRGTVDESVVLGPDARITLDWETFVRLACGRVRPEAVGDRLRFAGDHELSTRVLAHFSQKP
ncbi:maleylpyruvate isomerase family mycothiol-dependent enzyme [Kitasatospora cinereorecta]|uniref:Maleylpyruvate isomerase family mycothiol-dependent enzyme n=1 Tax=Kitasatospora cinereorecta TaxID=285560 RepID=A0ABW0VKU0_9ACTN